MSITTAEKREDGLRKRTTQQGEKLRAPASLVADSWVEYRSVETLDSRRGQNQAEDITCARP